MGRNGKYYKNLHIKCDKYIYEDLKNHVEKFNEKYKTNHSITKFIEVAIFEFLENHKEEIE